MSFQCRVSHLILASPLGVRQEPKKPKPPSFYYHPSFIFRMTRSFIIFLWNLCYTSQSFVRFMGPLGRLPVTIHVTHRFIIGPAIEDTLSATDEAGLETLAALAD